MCCDNINVLIEYYSVQWRCYEIYLLVDVTEKFYVLFFVWNIHSIWQFFIIWVTGWVSGNVRVKSDHAATHIISKITGHNMGNISPD